MNIKESVFKFFPQQTMTLSETELTERLSGFSIKNPVSHYISIYVMIDFKAWNTHWTKWSTEDVFAFIDKLFDLEDIYTYSHDFFKEALIALSSIHNPPDSLKNININELTPEECETLWYNHNGAFDGIRQKGWTLVTIGLLLLVENITGIKAQKIGQAENQVCRLYIPKLYPEQSDSDYIRNHSKQSKAYFINICNKVDGILYNIC